jgi:hypothetical protein
MAKKWVLGDTGIHPSSFFLASFDRLLLVALVLASSTGTLTMTDLSAKYLVLIHPHQTKTPQISRQGGSQTVERGYDSRHTPQLLKIPKAEKSVR